MPRFVPTGTKTGGGIGTVEIYTDTNLDRRVAVKFVPRGGSTTAFSTSSQRSNEFVQSTSYSCLMSSTRAAHVWASSKST